VLQAARQQQQQHSNSSRTQEVEATDVSKVLQAATQQQQQTTSSTEPGLTGSRSNVCQHSAQRTAAQNQHDTPTAHSQQKPTGG
jgi:hypothetical protein